MASSYRASAPPPLLLLLLLLPCTSFGLVVHPSSSSHHHRRIVASASSSSSSSSRLPRRHRAPSHRLDGRERDGGTRATAATSEDRRAHLASMVISLVASMAFAVVPSSPARAFGAMSMGGGEENGGGTTTTTTTRSTADAVVTDRIYIEFKGLSPSSSTSTPDTKDDVDDDVDRIVIGLFGNDSPQPVSVLLRLVTTGGYPSKCKSLDVDGRMLERERLEARRVYNSCLENEDSGGVNYDHSTVWRVIKDVRIDLGAVSGRYVARESPNFVDGPTRMRHDAPGVVSVRRWDGGGYGFTIYPGRGYDDENDASSSSSSTSTLDDDNIVVGRVIEGMDVVRRLNDVAVIRSAGAMLSSSGRELRGTPSRACRYGGSEYFCNENKPLRKILLDRTGVL
ncbi:hypothetical protein ACHAXA_008406 [Cyclostephanos tholiformis]|uniref:PPIase cyclophilin-type domain-containing protein n=1 Tax=Cyclostephanos tholiformis TaxID=382380 RepID=A0ABD3R5M8_9STRA